MDSINAIATITSCRISDILGRGLLSINKHSKTRRPAERRRRPFGALVSLGHKAPIDAHITHRHRSDKHHDFYPHRSATSLLSQDSKGFRPEYGDAKLSLSQRDYHLPRIKCHDHDRLDCYPCAVLTAKRRTSGHAGGPSANMCECNLT